MPLIIIENEGFVDSTYVSGVNPVWVAVGEFKKTGYNIKFETKSTAGETGSFIESEEADIICPDRLQATNLRHRLGILKQLPDFTYLREAYLPYGDAIDVLEQIAHGELNTGSRVAIAGGSVNPLEQMGRERITTPTGIKIPGAEHIQNHLTPLDLYAGLALGYRRSLDWESRLPRSGRMAFEQQDKITSLGAKLTALGVEPMSPQRMQVLVSGMIGRVETLLKG